MRVSRPKGSTLLPTWDLVRVPEGLLKGIYRFPQRDLWGFGFRVYLKGQGTQTRRAVMVMVTMALIKWS